MWRRASISRSPSAAVSSSASLVERLAACRRQAFHAGLDRDAAGAAEQLERMRFPEIDPRLDAELDAEADEAL